LASSWSPDESVVAIVTGKYDLGSYLYIYWLIEAKANTSLILLTSLFDVSLEKPLHVDDFGEGKPCPVSLQIFSPEPIC